VGVIVSLLYLAAQIRQNTASVRAGTYQDFTRESADITRAGLLDPAILEEIRPVLLAERDFDPTQDLRFGLVAGLYARNLQFGFLELQSGRIDSRHFDSYVSYHVENFMRRPGWSQWWAVNCRHYDPEFVRWVDSQLERSG
jgi:hypothetical protein